MSDEFGPDSRMTDTPAFPDALANAQIVFELILHFQTFYVSRETNAICKALAAYLFGHF